MNSLLKVNRPIQYLGKEFNLLIQSFSRDKLSFCLCYPHLYQVGMSSLGFRIIYGLLKSFDDIFTDRCFLPAQDYEETFLKEVPLSSLENKVPLKEFDVLGFSINYEIDYFNFLHMLHLSRICPIATQRRKPIIIVGGVINPEPLSEFVDIFVIGDGEPVLRPLIEILKRWKRTAKNIREFVRELSNLEGVYLPNYYIRVENNLHPKIDSLPSFIKKSSVKNLDESFFPIKWLVPYTEIVHDRVSIEVMRGCPHRCKFCQATIQYYPLRIRSKEKVIDLVKECYKNTGYEEFSLHSLSAGDYPFLKEVILQLKDFFKNRAVNISLPSLRPTPLVKDVCMILSSLRKPSLTFAPESFSPKIQKFIGKYISFSSIEEFIKFAQELFYTHIKLYFMIGLPIEEIEDIDYNIDCILRLTKVIRRNLKIHLSFSIFVPKPLTPLQNYPQLSPYVLSKRILYIKEKLQCNKYLRTSFHNPFKSFLETYLSRGDRKVSLWMYNFYNRMKRSSLQMRFNEEEFLLWRQLGEELGINVESYVLNELSSPEQLYWNYIKID